jgi:Holliday junction DNA helicase RuvB
MNKGSGIVPIPSTRSATKTVASMQQRVVSPKKQTEDIDNTLRPRRLIDYIGQEGVKGNLEISITAARQRGEALDHVLLYGPPGLGKTTLANIVATELGVRIKITSGPAIERPGDMVATLTQLKEHEVLFIDEIHRLSRVVEEVLYPAMEDFFVSWVIDKGLKARSMNLAIKPFTLIGATTRYGMISAPMRDRFGAVHRLEFYDEDAMNTIVKRSARILEISAEDDGLQEIAKRARGTPRIANRLLRQVRDYAQVVADNTITLAVAQEALARLEVDEIGLDKLDHQVLNSIIGKFDGGPVGLNTLAASINEESETIEDVYEPYLLQRGFLERTSRGRMATRLAYEHLGVEYPRERSQLNQGSLF